MDHLILETKGLLTQMETIVAEDDISYEDDNKLQDLYQEVKEKLEDISQYSKDAQFGMEYFKEISKLRRRFRDVCQEFETPDNIRDATMDSMFPDEESYEGFDVDKFSNND